MFVSSRHFSGLWRAGVLGLVLVAVAACSGSTVTRVDPEQRNDLTDEWNDDDSREVAEAMVPDMLSFPWVENFREENPDETPTITVLPVRNRTHTMIPTETITDAIQREILRSGVAEFTASGNLEEDLRAEQRNQEQFATAESAAQIAQELGAEYALAGSIDSQVQENQNRRVTTYTVALQLVEVTSTRIVWNNQHQIEKVVRRGGLF